MSSTKAEPASDCVPNPDYLLEILDEQHGNQVIDQDQVPKPASGTYGYTVRMSKIDGGPDVPLWTNGNMIYDDKKVQFFGFDNDTGSVEVRNFRFRLDSNTDTVLYFFNLCLRNGKCETASAGDKPYRHVTVI